MYNPHVININCDGAMDRDQRQTGGNGFCIEFPDFLNLEPISKSIRNDGQGIHRLEMISILESMEKLLSFGKQNPGILHKVAGVNIYTDRIKVTDAELLNPYRIQEYRKNRWLNHENKPIKDKDLLDKIDKIRKKLHQEVGGIIKIEYIPEKKNKNADKLSKIGKRSLIHDKKIIKKKRVHVTRRIFDGPEIDYSLIHENDLLIVHVYIWEAVQNQFELKTEIMDGQYLGRIIRIYVAPAVKTDVHLNHCYEVKIKNVYTHHVEIESFKEISRENILSLKI